MPRRGENIFKRKDGRWEARYKKGIDSAGKTVYGYVYARTYNEVKQKVMHAKEQAKSTETMFPNNSNNNLNITFQEASEQWITSNQFHVKESTIVRYQNLLTNHIYPVLGDFPCNQVNSNMLETFVRDKLDHGRIDRKGGLAPKTVKDMLSLIHQILYNNGNVPAHTFQMERINIHRPETQVAIFTVEHQIQLVKYLLSNASAKNIGILMCMYMGLRIGEICALRWNDISLDEGTLRVRSTMQRLQNLSGKEGPKTRVIITSPKSDSSVRDIPIP